MKLAIFIGIVALAAPVSAAAAPATASAVQGSPATARAAAPARTQVTTFLLDHPGVATATLMPVMRSLDDGLRRNSQLDMQDLAKRLAGLDDAVPTADVAHARALFVDGQQALGALDLDKAIKQLTESIDALSKVLPYIKKQELADAMMALAAAELENGSRREGTATLVRLFTWRPGYRFDSSRYPPKFLPAFKEAQRRAEHARRGTLEIRSDPTAARAFVDGRYVGVTPVEAKGLPVGEHYVTVKLDGYRKAAAAATVEGRARAEVRLPLARAGDSGRVTRALDVVEQDLGEARLPESAVGDLQKLLHLDEGVFVRAVSRGHNLIEIDAFRYDLRSGRRLANVTRVVTAATAETELDPMASLLYAGPTRSDTAVAALVPPAAKKRHRPYYKTWWFWTTIGVAVAGGVTAGVLLRPQSKDCGANNYCPGFTF